MWAAFFITTAKVKPCNDFKLQSFLNLKIEFRTEFQCYCKKEIMRNYHHRWSNCMGITLKQVWLFSTVNINHQDKWHQLVFLTAAQHYIQDCALSLASCIQKKGQRYSVALKYRDRKLYFVVLLHSMLYVGFISNSLTDLNRTHVAKVLWLSLWKIK